MRVSTNSCVKKHTKKKIYITIFSYLREEMLANLIDEINVFKRSNELNYTIDYIILDDGSDFTRTFKNIKHFKHEGKPGFWKKWDYALKNIKYQTYDIAMFIPTDYSLIDFEEIIEAHNAYCNDTYIYNLANDGRESCWNPTIRKQINQYEYQCHFTDCGFFTNKKTLNKLGYEIKPINPNRFNNPEISSGVGQQLTRRLNKLEVKMYTPIESMVFHGNHLSTMHPELRLKNPLITR